MTWWKHSVASKYDAIIADGSIRAGKTLCMSTSFLIWAMTTYDGHNFAICGKTVTSCRRNVITPLMSEMDGEMQFKTMWTQNCIEVKYKGNTNKFHIFGGRDESSASLIQGVTLAGILLDEVALMPRSFVEQALARCSVEGSKFWFNCNPEHPEHWFYKNWISDHEKKRALYVHFVMSDNPTLSEDMRKRYESLFSGVFYDRYIRGIWIVAEGIIYPMFSKAFHAVPVEPRPYQEYQISIDYGTVNPFSMGLWGLANGVWYRIKEYYHNSRLQGKSVMTDEEYYAELEKFAKDIKIKKIIIDPSAASFIALIRRKGKYHVVAADNAVLPGISNVASALKLGKIKFNDCCKDTFNEFGLYRWDDKAQDTPIKENDHAMDEIRYFVRTNKISLPKQKSLTDYVREEKGSRGNYVL